MPDTPEPTPTPAEPPARSRDLTKYLILEPTDDGAGTDYVTYKVAVKHVEARTPDRAIEIAQERAPDLKKCPRLVAVPVSSWHKFEPATTWTKVS